MTHLSPAVNRAKVKALFVEVMLTSYHQVAATSVYSDDFFQTFCGQSNNQNMSVAFKFLIQVHCCIENHQIDYVCLKIKYIDVFAKIRWPD